MYINYTVTKQEDKMRLNLFLRQKGISLAHIKRVKFIKDGILVNDKKQNTDYTLNINDEVRVLIDINKDEKTNIIPQDIPLDIMYEDEFCIIVNKPYGMPSHPSLNHPLNTLANAFCGYYQKKGESKTARIITRLDKNTSGLCLIALNSFAAEWFKNKVKKEYCAIVKGKLAKKEDIINYPIARVSESIITRYVHESGKKALTQYKVVKQNDDFSFVNIKLHTGRTHQIRVHFSYIGHPLLGDSLYGGDDKLIERQALHAKKLTFYPVFSKKERVIKAPLEKDMQKIVDLI